MGFWQGINEGLTFVLEQKARKKEIEQARQDRMAERESDIALRRDELAQSRKFAVEDRQYDQEQRMQEMLFNLGIDRKKLDKGAQKLQVEASKLYQILPDNADEKKLSVFKNDPAAAAEAYGLISDIMTKSAAAGMPMSPEAALSFVYVDSVGEVKSTAPDLDISHYPKTYEGVMAYSEAVSSSQPTTVVSLNPNAYAKPNTDNMKIARASVEQEVMKQANAALGALASDPAAQAQLQASIDAFTNPTSEGYATLMAKFGQPAFNTIASQGDAFAVAAMQDPSFAEFSRARMEDINTATQYINDPNSTEEEVAMAKELLKKAYGGNYGG